MTDFIAAYAPAIWAAISSIAVQTGLIFYDSAPFIMLGCLVAGLLHAFIPSDFIVRYMGGNNLRSVVWAAILGAPVPLCSCSVLPTAMALRRKGASKAAIASFLISVPETDAENVAITYGLMGPVMAIYRPIVGVITAISAGMLTILFRDRNEDVATGEALAADGHDNHQHDHAHDHDHDHDHHHHENAQPEARPDTGVSKASVVLHYGFVELIDEIAFWLTFGLVLTGVMLGLLPENFFVDVGLGGGIVPMLMMILISVPLYTCASMSAPIGAGLIATGLSPGAALVYLLCGPATSMATLPVIARLLGGRLLAAYLIALIGVAIAAGLLLDWMAGDLVREAVRAGRVEPDSPTWAAIKLVVTIGFVGLLVASFRRGSFRHGLHDLSANLAHLRVLGRVTALPWPEWSGRASKAVFGSVLSQTLDNAAVALRGHSARRAAAGIVGLAGIWLLAQAFFLVVDVGQRGMIQRFGTVVARDLEPGLYMHLPAPLGRGLTVDAADIRQLMVDAGSSPSGRGDAAARGLFLTSDENVIDLQAVVQYRVGDPYKAAFAAAEADRIVRAAGQQVLTELAMTMPIDSIYTVGRATLEAQFIDRLTQRVATFDIGYDVVAARLVYIHAPADVHNAFRDVASALEDRARAIFEADGDAATAISQASGRAARTLAVSRADAVTARRLAEGKTVPFAALAKVHRAAPGITERRLLLETVERRFAAPKKYINGAGLPDSAVDLWLDGGTTPSVKFRFND